MLAAIQSSTAVKGQPLHSKHFSSARRRNLCRFYGPRTSLYDSSHHWLPPTVLTESVPPTHPYQRTTTDHHPYPYPIQGTRLCRTITTLEPYVGRPSSSRSRQMDFCRLFAQFYSAAGWSTPLSADYHHQASRDDMAIGYLVFRLRTAAQQQLVGCNCNKLSMGLLVRRVCYGQGRSQSVVS